MLKQLAIASKKVVARETGEPVELDRDARDLILVQGVLGLSEDAKTKLLMLFHQAERPEGIEAEADIEGDSLSFA